MRMGGGGGGGWSQGGRGGVGGEVWNIELMVGRVGKEREVERE